MQTFGQKRIEYEFHIEWRISKVYKIVGRQDS